MLLSYVHDVSLLQTNFANDEIAQKIETFSNYIDQFKGSKLFLIKSNAKELLINAYCSIVANE